MFSCPDRKLYIDLPGDRYRPESGLNRGIGRLPETGIIRAPGNGIKPPGGKDPL